MSGFYNPDNFNRNNYNPNNVLQYLSLADAERDDFNNLIYKKSSIKSFYTPAFFLIIALATSFFIIFSEEFKILNLIYFILPLALLIFFFANAVKGTYTIKVSDSEISKKFLLGKKVTINYKDIETAEILTPKTNKDFMALNSLNGPSINIIGTSLIIKSARKTIKMPITVKGFSEFYKIFLENFPNEESRQMLKKIALSYLLIGIDLEQRKVVSNNNDPFNPNISPFEGF